MARKRQIILLSGTDDPKSGGMAPLGSPKEVIASFGAFNTSPDGSGPTGVGEALGMAILHGPGYIVEVPTGGDEVNQVMVTVTDEDFAWAVLMRLCRSLGLRMMDPESGRTFG